MLPLLSVVLEQFTNSQLLGLLGSTFNLSQDPKGQLCMFILKFCLQVLRIAPPLDELGLKAASNFFILQNMVKKKKKKKKAL